MAKLADEKVKTQAWINVSNIMWRTEENAQAVVLFNKSFIFPLRDKTFSNV